MDIESLNKSISLMSNGQLQAVKILLDSIMADCGKGDAMFAEIGKRIVTAERYISYQIDDRVKT